MPTVPDKPLPWGVQGLGATLVRNVPANSVYLGSFEVMKRAVAERQNKPVGELHPGAALLLSCIVPAQNAERFGVTSPRGAGGGKFRSGHAPGT